MRVIIAGSRSITDQATVDAAVEASGFLITEVVSGTARGVDRLGEAWAQARSIPIVRFPADWDKYARAAGPIRNRQMAEYGEALIVVMVPKSRGSLNMVQTMKKFGKPSSVVIIEES